MFAAHPVRLDRASAALESIEPPPLSDRSWRELRLALQPTGYWAFDAPEPWNLEGEDSADTPDFNPVREARVIWSNGSGDVGEAEMYIPGSSVKGAISHRVAFHANRAARVFADLQEESASPGDASGEGNPAVRDLFGSIHRSPRAGKNGDDEPEEESGGSAGKVYLDDVRIPAHFHGRLQRVMHNSSDRFTGGVRAGILFEERVLYRGDPLEVTLRVKDFDGLRSETLAALREALRDLSEGRLQLGAGGGRGHGYFKSVRPFDELWAEFTGGVQ